MHSDASDVDYGGYIVEHGMMGTGNLVFRGSKAELYLERSTVVRVLESVAGRLSSTRVC